MEMVSFEAAGGKAKTNTRIGARKSYRYPNVYGGDSKADGRRPFLTDCYTSDGFDNRVFGGSKVCGCGTWTNRALGRSRWHGCWGRDDINRREWRPLRDVNKSGILRFSGANTLPFS